MKKGKEDFAILASANGNDVAVFLPRNYENKRCKCVKIARVFEMIVLIYFNILFIWNV